MATYYVKNGGNDGLSGTSDGNAWATLSKVKSTAVNGDVVNLKAGSSWSENLNTLVSGVTLQAYGTGNRPRVKGADWTSKSYITLDGLEVWNDNSGAPFEATSCNHLTINNCYIYATSANGSWTACYFIGCNYCVFTHNTVDHQNIVDFKDGLGWDLGCSHNVIAYNSTKNGTHYSFAVTGGGGTSSTTNLTSNYNYIGHNDVHNPVGAGLQVYQNSHYNIIEYNTVWVNNAVRSPYPTICKVLGDHNIFRFNLLQAAPEFNETLGRAFMNETYTYASGWAANTCRYFHCYNNIIYNGYGTENPRGAIHIGTADNPGEIGWNYYKNNIIYKNRLPAQITKHSSTVIHDIYFSNNIVFRNNTTENIVYTDGSFKNIYNQERYDPVHWQKNKQEDPQLNMTTFEPLPGSPCISGGAFLTTVTSNTTNQPLASFTVADAGYFHDGMGLPGIEADSIKVGSNVPVKITTVNYSTNTITVASPITWNKGDNVSLPFNNSAPDIGIYTYEPVYVPSGINIGGAAKFGYRQNIQGGSFVAGGRYYTGSTHVMSGGMVINDVSGVVGITTPPQGVSATAGTQQVRIQFIPVIGVTYYNLYWSLLPGVTTYNSNKITRITNPYFHTGLTPNTRFYYVVTAVNSFGESAPSAEVNAITPTTQIKYPNLPDPVDPSEIVNFPVVPINLIDKLPSYFDKESKPLPLFRIVGSDIIGVKVSNDLKTLEIYRTMDTRVINIKATSISQIKAALQTNGYTLETYTDEYDMLLNHTLTNDFDDPITTNVHYEQSLNIRMMNAFEQFLLDNINIFLNGLNEAYFSMSDSEWLTLWCNYFGYARRTGETDQKVLTRTINGVTALKLNGYAMMRILMSELDLSCDIYDYDNLANTFVIAFHGVNVSQLPQAQIDTIIESIDAYRAAGCYPVYVIDGIMLKTNVAEHGEATNDLEWGTYPLASAQQVVVLVHS